MPSTKRNCPAGEVFPVLNRAVARLAIFEKPEDYSAFMRVLDQTFQIVPLPIFAMVAMPNHWHFVVRPETSDQVSEFFRRLTVMRHVERNPVQANFTELAENLEWMFSAHSYIDASLAAGIGVASGRREQHPAGWIPERWALPTRFNAYAIPPRLCQSPPRSCAAVITGITLRVFTQRCMFLLSCRGFYCNALLDSSRKESRLSSHFA